LGAQPAMKIGSYAGVKLAFQDNPRQRVDTVSPGETSNSQPRGSNTWHTNPHEIAPDNGPRRLGTNFSEPWRQGLNIDQAVHKAFQDLLVPRPADFLNEANQGYIGPPGAGANW
jgi:hypothetical protein